MARFPIAAAGSPDEKPPRKSIYRTKQVCICGHIWKPILVEFKKNEILKMFTLTCPDCGLTRKFELTRAGKGH